MRKELAGALITSIVMVVTTTSAAPPPLPTTIEDFFQPGTQPEPDEMVFRAIKSSNQCTFCHSDYYDDNFNEPYDAWKGTVMGQSARDPVWHAALTIANQDADFAGEYCIRCHAPIAWLGGRSVPTDASGFVEDLITGQSDYDSVTCHLCHRMVNPVLDAESPAEDVDILAALEFPPGGERGNGRYVVDPADVRRGPFDDIEVNLHGLDDFGNPVEIIPSPYHRRSEICATCHDLGNPVFTRQSDGTYAFNEPGSAHPTGVIAHMFPEQTTYSEWKYSAFANGGVDFPDGRFGGNHPTGIMQECQDCHMPDVFAGGCRFWEQPPFFPRPDMPQHSFGGANYWMVQAVHAANDPKTTGLTDEIVANARAATEDMLRAASDMHAVQVGDTLRVRVVNWSGHRLPSGYPEGRRMWINVQFYDAGESLIGEFGEYDYALAELHGEDTKVYESIHGISPELAADIGREAGPSSHLVLNDQILFDNRIPPVGWDLASWEAFGGAPVGATYADGQHWDDTEFAVPVNAVTATITLLYQPMTREYAEFLRDENTTDTRGDVFWDLYSDPAVGNFVPPFDMDSIALSLGAPVPGDVNSDGVVDFNDLLAILVAWGPCEAPALCATDIDGDGEIRIEDLMIVFDNWS